MRQLVQEKENSEFKPVKLRLKIDLVSYPARAEGLVNIIIIIIIIIIIMHNPAPVLEKDTHKLLWDFNIQTDHLNPTRIPDLIIINKKRKFVKLSTLPSRRNTE